MSQTARRARQAAGWAGVGARAVLGPVSGPTSGILVYHRVTGVVDGLPWPSLNVTPERLAAQVEGLRAMGWHFVPLADLAADRGARSRRVAVTFDDIYGNVATAAHPVLSALGVPFTVFVASAFVGSEQPFPFDDWALAHRGALDPEAYRPVGLAHLRALAADPLVTVGAHTHTHRAFSGRPEAFARDLSANLAWLRETLGVERPPFAYPYGRTAFGLAGGALACAALRLGVSATYTTDGGPVPAGRPPVDWPRITAYSTDTATTLDAKLLGRFAWTLRLSERVGRALGRT